MPGVTGGGTDASRSTATLDGEMTGRPKARQYFSERHGRGP
jgi:hypothetical protein